MDVTFLKQNCKLNMSESEVFDEATAEGTLALSSSTFLVKSFNTFLKFTCLLNHHFIYYSYIPGGLQPHSLSYQIKISESLHNCLKTGSVVLFKCTEMFIFEDKEGSFWDSFIKKKFCVGIWKQKFLNATVIFEDKTSCYTSMGEKHQKMEEQ